MRVIIEGDSCAEPRDDNWPILLARLKGWYPVNLSQHRSDSDEVLQRLTEAMYVPPNLYILQLGQWSSHNEMGTEFLNRLGLIVSTLHRAHVKVCLVTPPCLDDATAAYAERLVTTARVYNTMLVDVHKHMQAHGADRSWFLDAPDQIPCHLNLKGALIVTQFFIDRLENPYKGGL
jgi:hypothetical protein